MKNRSETAPKKELRCGKCGATAARNGNPFSAFTLRVHQGRMHGPKLLHGQPSPFNLSLRQGEIMKQICAGKMESAIAKRFGLSYHTVHEHVRNIYQKLGVHNRAEAVKKWLEETSQTRRLSRPAPTRSLQFCPSCGCHLAALLAPPLPFAASAAAGLNLPANRNHPDCHG